MVLEPFHRRTVDPRRTQDLDGRLPKSTAFLIIIICSLVGWGLIISIGTGV
jgi:hypothetical protein